MIFFVISSWSFKPWRFNGLDKWWKTVCTEFKDANGDGFEVVNANTPMQEISLGNQWSEKYGMLASIGSDFHGWPNQRVQIGNLADLPNNNRAIWSHL